MATTSFRALGTTALLVTPDASALDESERILRRELDAIDRACSRFRDDSELSGVNRASGAPAPAGPLLREAVRAALEAARTTGGDVDPTIGDAMAACGYDRDFSRISGALGTTPRASHRLPRWRAVVVDDTRGTVRVPAGTMLDLGATAKALAADRAARAIHAATGPRCWCRSAGTSPWPGRPPAAGWPVRVTDDHRGTGPATRWSDIRDGGLATSAPPPGAGVAAGASTTSSIPAPARRRRGLAHGRASPRGPVSRPTSASTAAIVRGRSAPAWLAARGLPARLVAPDGAVTRVGRMAGAAPMMALWYLMRGTASSPSCS